MLEYVSSDTRKKTNFHMNTFINPSNVNNGIIQKSFQPKDACLLMTVSFTVEYFVRVCV